MSHAAVLVVNAGSSSLKYQLVRPDSGMALASGLVERIGLSRGAARHSVGAGRSEGAGSRQTDGGAQATASAGTRHTREIDVPDHQAAFQVLREMFAEHGPDLAEASPVAVGHRVVHGGSRFSKPTVVDDEVVEALRELIPLAPLHNPGNVVGIEVSRRVFPEVPQVAVFDTAFHQSMPAAAYTYAVPARWRQEHGVRREHNPQLRAAVLSRAGALGIKLDERANAEAVGEALITTPDSRVAAYVVPTNEEWEIARQAAHVVSG